MSYKQTINFNPSKGGTVKYWCLRNTRLGYGLGPKYSMASVDWNNNIQHKTKVVPGGVDVPVFWEWWGWLSGKYINWGHVAVRLADGRVWTDGRIYPSIDAVTNQYLGGKAKYVGWGELLEGKRVITKKKEEDMLTTHGQNVLYRFYLGRGPDKKAKLWVGKHTFDKESARITRSAEYKARVKSVKASKTKVNDHLASSMR